jgi:hypothetical protein
MTAIRPALQPDARPLPRGLPDPRAHHLHEQQQHGRDAAERRPALQRYAEDWARDGVEVWPKWFEILEATADSAARFLGAPAGQTILNQNVAYFQAAVASSLDFSEGRATRSSSRPCSSPTSSTCGTATASSAPTSPSSPPTTA